MNTFYVTVRRLHVLAGLLVLLLTTSSLAEDSDVKVPFLFIEDDKLGQTDLSKVIPKSSELQQDRYLNAPLTRLEYMLTNLERRLNRDLTKGAVQKILSDSFESSRRKSFPSASIEAVARHDRESGRIIIGYNIRDLGQPKRSMRTSCDGLLSFVDGIAPQTIEGFGLHSVTLGVLAQEPYREYTPIMETLARNVVQRVQLLSVSEDSNVHHGLACQKTGKGLPTQYYRFSFTLR